MIQGSQAWQAFWAIIILGTDGVRSASIHGVDAWTVVFAIIAMLPAVRHFATSVDLDILQGHIKITASEVASAARNVTDTNLSAITGTPAPAITSIIATSQAPQTLHATGSVANQLPRLAPLSLALYNIDPNIALVNLRIEIERRIREIAELAKLAPSRGLTTIIRTLVQQERLDPTYGEGLQTLIGLGNKAAHGARIEPDAAAYAQQLEPQILASLEEKIADLKQQYPPDSGPI